MIPLFGLLLIASVALLIVKRRHLLKIHFCLIVIVSAYTLTLIFKEIDLKRRDSSDDASSWWIALAVLNAIYDFIFFLTLILASSGWCLLHNQLSLRIVLLSVSGVAVFVIISFVQAYVELGFWEIGTMVIQILSVIAVFYCIWTGAHEGQRLIKAHLLTIQRAGIDFKTTPVFQKFTMYIALLWVICSAFVGYLALNVILVITDAGSWWYVLFGSLIQLAVMCGLMYLYRPRGESIDRYLQTDEEEEGKRREEITLADLDGFTMDQELSEQRPWVEEMELPLQPVVIAPQSRLTGNSLMQDNSYTASDQLT
jgi:hypothetical protein